MKRKRDYLLRALLIWTTLLTGILVWLPLIRGLVEGSGYQWAFADGIGGRGTHGAYWMLVLAAVFCFFLLFLGRRGAPLPFHWLFLGLHVSFAAAVLAATVSNPRQLSFEGATMGVRFSLAVIGPVWFGTVALLSLIWVMRDLRGSRRRALVRWRWTRESKILIAIVLGMIPLQVVLLRAKLASPPEQIGVFLTITQWFLLNAAMNAEVAVEQSE